MNKLEKDFEETIKEVNIKIKEAAKIMKEANKLIRNSGLESTINKFCDYNETCSDKEYQDIENLMNQIEIYYLNNEMNSGIWVHSSLQWLRRTIYDLNWLSCAITKKF